MTARTDAPSAEVRIRAMKRDRFMCTYCGIAGTDAELEIDHIIPVALGGSHHISNLTTACRACNQKKGAKLMKPADRVAVREGAQDAAPRIDGVVGLWLWILRDDETKTVARRFIPAGKAIHNQGTVISTYEGRAIIQLFSWLHGGPTTVTTLPLEDLFSDGCVLFSSDEHMRDAYDSLPGTD